MRKERMIVCRDKWDYTNFVFLPKENNCGVTYSCSCWEHENNNPSTLDFFADAYIKWDYCSHFNFKGEDFDDEEEIDGYYHICGAEMYLEFFLGMLFTNKCILEYQDNPYPQPKEKGLIDKWWNNNFSEYKIEVTDTSILDDHAYFQIFNELKE